MRKLSKLYRVSLIVLIGFFVAAGFNYACTFYFGFAVYPRCTFLFRPDQVWGDLLGLAAANKNLDPFHNTFRTYGINYPPFTYLLMLPFTNILEWPRAGVLYAACTATGILLFVAWACRTRPDDDPMRFGWLAALIIGVASYPVLFAIERLNSDNAIFLIVAAGLVAEISSARRWSPFIWGTACATKIYPGLFGVIYIVERRWKDLGVLVAVAAAWTVVSMAVFRVGPSEALDSYARATPNFKALIVWFDNVQHTSSLFAVVRLIQAWRYGIDPTFREMTFEQATASYIWIGGAVLVLLLSSAIKNSTLVLWERAFLVTSIIIVVPHTSFDYKLLYVFLPLALFLNDDRTEWRRASWYCVGFGLLLIPKHYYLFFEDSSISVVLNPLILLGMSFPLVAMAWAPEIRWLSGRHGDDRAVFSRYVVTGIWNTAFGYGVFVLLLAALSSRVHYLVVAVLSNVLAITNAYVVHKIFVFRTQGNHLQEYFKYYVVYGTAALCGLVLLAALASGLGVNVYVAQAVVLGLQALLSFAGHQRFSFGPPRTKTL